MATDDTHGFSPPGKSMRDWMMALKNANIRIDNLTKSSFYASENKCLELYNIWEEGLPAPEFEVFFEKIEETDICDYINNCGTPYWISVFPIDNQSNLPRYKKLNLNSSEEGINFVKSLEKDEIKDIAQYSFALIQYVSDCIFKGTAIFKDGEGIVELIEGEHGKLTGGEYTPHTMHVKNNEILNYDLKFNRYEVDKITKFLKDKTGYFEVHMNYFDKYVRYAHTKILTTHE
ncbi:MAG: hypothetical protein CVU81_03505 [Euryarchaeota archaeon HGW-Euryarchaeota-1]|nr:MAG: hypothetical protein CVU81_03505 [Euryarchaeota archaeon HGW-Euryarchaeota-1]